MENKLQATVDIGSMSCIMLIAAFEDAPSEKEQAPAQAETADAANPGTDSAAMRLLPLLRTSSINS